MDESELAKGYINEIRKCTRPLTFMEVCGTHTMNICRYGLRGVLPGNIRLLSGPGCPVCVTSIRDIDLAITIACIPGLIFTTFGDMMRVPGSYSSLIKERAGGRDVRVVYSIMEALEIAKLNPSRPVVFFSVGFETTAPGTAFGIVEASKAKLKNFSVLCIHKTLPGALRSLLNAGRLVLNGFLLPGHVSAVTGVRAYDFLAEEYGIGGVVAGFEPKDILGAIYTLINRQEATPMIENGYRRVVRDEGNQAAMRAIRLVFDPCDSVWRGLGLIPGSGLVINGDWREFDALRRYGTDAGEPAEHKGCACGAILCGLKVPAECSMFGTVCTPENPVGPCMVSSEGYCAACYKYSGVSILNSDS